MSTQVHVAIYATYDDRDPNHWAIFLDNSQEGTVILQVADDVAKQRYFVDQPIHNRRPNNSGRHEHSVEVGEIAPGYHEFAVGELKTVPVDNESQTWNCQAWVVEALDHLEQIGIFEWKAAGKKDVLERRQHWQ